MKIPDSGYMMENGSIQMPCTPEEVRRIVWEFTEKAESNLQQGNLYYLISSRWFLGWQRYKGQPIDAHVFDEHSIEPQSTHTADKPRPIDNSDIVVNGGEGDEPQLLQTVEGQDCVIFPQDVWDRLYEC